MEIVQAGFVFLFFVISWIVFGGMGIEAYRIPMGKYSFWQKMFVYFLSPLLTIRFFWVHLMGEEARRLFEGQDLPSDKEN